MKYLRNYFVNNDAAHTGIISNGMVNITQRGGTHNFTENKTIYNPEGRDFCKSCGAYIVDIE